MCRQRIHITVLVAAVGLCLVLAGCGRRGSELPVKADARHPGRYLLEFEAMGTDARLIVAAPDAATARTYMRPAVLAIRRVETLMSTYRPESEISALNRMGAKQEVPLSGATLQVLRDSVRFSRMTDGAFDVCYAPLRTLWRKAEREGKLPSDDEIYSTLRAVGSDKLVLSERGARFSVEGMEVDLGGIAKGFGIETAAQAMRKAGAKSALVVVGGEMRAVGRREDGSPWKVQVRDPRPGAHEPIVLRLDDKAAATSGDYARYFRVGERKLSHIVDPRTGWPVANVPSATVVAADAVTTDALATGISVLGPEKAIKLIDSLGDAECMMMVRTEETEGTQVKLYYSKGFRALMEEGRK